MPTVPFTGTCSRGADFEIDADGKITSCKILGGCPGNTVGVAKLAIGRDAAEVAKMLRGTPCPSGHGSSCPDQLARALEAELERRSASIIAP